MEQKQEKSRYQYPMPDWKALPMDFTLQEFSKKYRLQPSHIRRTVERASYQGDTPVSSLYYHMFLEKKGIPAEAWRPESRKNGEKQDWDAADAKTSPVALYWELEFLVRHLERAARAHKKSGTEELIGFAFQEMGRTLAACDDPAGDYRNLCAMAQPPVRTAMVQDCFAEIRRRFDAIEKCLRETDTIYLPFNLRLALQKLDDLILRLDDARGLHPASDDAPAALDTLYERLMRQRKEMTMYSQHGAQYIRFRPGPEAERLCALLDQAGHRRTLALDDPLRPGLDEAYNACLLSLETTEEDDALRRFSRDFQYLKRYISDTLDEGRLEAELLDWFYGELRADFREVEQCDQTGYRYESTDASGMRSAAANELKHNELQQIRYALHQPMHWLRVSAVLIAFRISEDPGNRLPGLIRQLGREIHTLIKSYPDLPLVRAEEPVTFEAVQRIPPPFAGIAGESNLLTAYLRSPDLSGGNRLAALWHRYCVLWADCLMVATAKAQEAVGEIIRRVRLCS